MKKGTLVKITFLDHAIATSRSDGEPIQGVAVGFLRHESPRHYVLTPMVLGSLDDDDSAEIMIVKTPGIKIRRLCEV